MHIQRTLGFRVLLPIVGFAVLLLAAMAGFALYAAQHFAHEQATNSLRLRAHTVRQIVDDNYGGLRRHGRVDNAAALREARVDTLLTIEDFARINGLQVIVVDRESQRTIAFGELGMGIEDLPIPAGPSSISDQREVRRFAWREREFQAFSLNFDPWGWELTLIEPTAGYQVLQGELFRGALIAGAILVAGAAIFFLILGRLIQRPVDRIIDSLRAGRPPDYRGIAEFEFLAEAIAKMMAAVGEKSEKLERYQDHLEQLVAERTTELTQANKELKAINADLAEAQSQLLQSEKMAAIGQLAAGVAHEINNPIGFVTSNLTTLETYLHGLLRLIDAYDRQIEQCAVPAASEAVFAMRKEVDFDYMRADVQDLLAECQEGLARVRQIVIDLKDFSRVDNEDWQRVDLHRGLESTLNIVWNEIKYKAEVVRDYGVLPEIECLPNQLNQVFMNLLVNAAQAIAVRGTITIRTRALDDHVLIEFADTGAGIHAENLPRIFEPFFTTKPVGQGTGLGLSLVYGIVRKHGGHVEVESSPGQGARFRVTLPVRRRADEARDAGQLRAAAG